MNDTSPAATNISNPTLIWLKACNQILLGWAASLTWTRLVILAIVMAIAGSMIAKKFDLEHGHQMVKVDNGSNDKAEDIPDEITITENISGCGKGDITIGNTKFQVVCEDKKTMKTDPPGGLAASAPRASASATKPALIEDHDYAVKIRSLGSQKSEPTMERHIQRTTGGLINDFFSTLYVAFFAYLIAAKIIVRKSQESDAKVRVATNNAEHEALERQLVQARLKVLQAQVEPHFLFNTLAAVDYLIETDPPRASIMQKQLITYLRGALPQMREDSSTLGRELRLVRAYLELLKMRIEDRLDFVIDVPDSLFNADFPPMVLQSIVENAIKHGIEPKPEGGKIIIHAQARDGNLWVDVVDTGVGLTDGDVFGKTSNGGGLGLDNIRKRLALLYPNASRIELRSEIPSGTSVRIMVPFQNSGGSTTAR
ncbi:MAG: histidine kinase [Candidatus Saccharibacteria bacterium]|nr:histidine kinase [Rhodoferax sp.]